MITLMQLIFMKQLIFLALFSIVFIFCIKAQNKKTGSDNHSSITTNAGVFSFTPYATNIIKVTYTPNVNFENENISDAVVLNALNEASTYKVSENNENIIFKNFNIIKKNEKIIIKNSSEISLVEGELKNNFQTIKIELYNDEKIFGGGERALPLNRRGYKFNLYNNPWYGYDEGADNLNYSVPFFTSSNGYGLFFDNPSKGFADIGKNNPLAFEVGFVSGEINVYIIFGKTYQQILQSYHQLTGTQPLPPRWALGNLMSRFGYTSQQQVTDIVAKMKKAEIPVDAVIFDLFWFGDSIRGTLGNLDWVNKKAWNNPKKMVTDFKKDGINTILITEPFVLENTKYYNEAKKYFSVDNKKQPYTLTDFYFGQGGLIDIFRKDAQQWFWSKHKPQMNLGVEGWWGDLGEPEKHPNNLYHQLTTKGGKLKILTADAVHNLYGHTWTKMLHTQFAKEYPSKRLFSLNRSGFAGSQRYNIFPWTGDVSRSWSGFKAQLPILLGMSMSGVPYVHSDAGGFAGGDGDNELYVRWLQFAAFTPIFRPHGTALYEVDKNAFSYPSEAALIDEPYKSYARQAIIWRNSLLPYNYNLSYLQAKNGSPLIAPLYYYFSDDKKVYNVEDEFMWGENILVAPVIEKGATTRKIYLPKGNWMNSRGKQFVSKGEWFTETVEISDIPLFYKEGSFIPFLKVKGKNVAQSNFNNVQILYCISTKPSEYELFNDDGVDKNSLTHGNYSITKFSSSGLKNGKISFTIAAKKINAANKKAQYLLSLPLEKKPTNVTINNKKILLKEISMVELKGYLWDEEAKTLLLDIPFDGSKIVVNVELK